MSHIHEPRTDDATRLDTCMYVMHEQHGLENHCAKHRLHLNRCQAASLKQSRVAKSLTLMASCPFARTLCLQGPADGRAECAQGRLSKTWGLCGNSTIIDASFLKPCGLLYSRRKKCCLLSAFASILRRRVLSKHQAHDSDATSSWPSGTVRLSLGGAPLVEASVHPRAPVQARLSAAHPGTCVPSAEKPIYARGFARTSEAQRIESKQPRLASLLCQAGSIRSRLQSLRGIFGGLSFLRCLQFCQGRRTARSQADTPGVGDFQEVLGKRRCPISKKMPGANPSQNCCQQEHTLVMAGISFYILVA